MNSTLDAAPPSRLRERTETRRTSPLRTLARAEGRRLVRHPVTLFGAALSWALFAVATWRSAPVLHRDDILTGLGVLPLAAATFVVANAAALRSHRHGTDELFDSTATARDVRTAAHLLSVAWAVALAALLVASFVVYLVVGGPVGTPSPWELLAGPAVVGVAGALGVALGTWMHSVAVAPLALVVLIATEIFVQYQINSVVPEYGSGSPARWLALWVPISYSGNPARELVIRPAGWHLVYLAALAAVIAAAAVTRHRPRPIRTVALALGVALVATAAWQQLASFNAAARGDLVRAYVDHPRRTCETRSGITFCAHPAYAGWISRWARVADGVVGGAPAHGRPAVLRVTQTLMAYGSDLPTDALSDFETSRGVADASIVVGSDWGRDGAVGRYEAALALAIASATVGFPASRDEIRLSRDDIERLARGGEEGSLIGDGTRPGDPWGDCSTSNQARAVVAVWLAATATPESRAQIVRAVRESQYDVYGVGPGVTGPNITGYSSTGPDQWELGEYDYVLAPVDHATVRWTRIDVFYALQLVGRPRDAVAAELTAHWEELMRPSTPSSRIVQLFGLRRPPRPEALYPPAVAEEVRRDPQRDPLASTVRCP